jgi:anti-sigma factor RsiW
MKCEECLRSLDDYIDGESDEATANRVTAHLTACAQCQAEYELIERERDAYAEYRREVRVSVSVWDGVRREMENVKRERRRRRFGRLRDWLATFVFTPRLTLAHAGLLAAVAVGVTVGAVHVERKWSERAADGADRVEKKTVEEKKAVEPRADSEPKIVTETPAPNSPKVNIVKPARAFLVSAPVRKPARPADGRGQSAAELIRDAETKYAAAINQLLRETRGKRERLDVATQIKFNGALADIDAAIAETRKAVRRNPKDPVAVQYMLTAYGRKVDALQEIAHSKSE